MDRSKDINHGAHRDRELRLHAREDRGARQSVGNRKNHFCDKLQPTEDGVERHTESMRELDRANSPRVGWGENPAQPHDLPHGRGKAEGEHPETEEYVRREFRGDQKHMVVSVHVDDEKVSLFFTEEAALKKMAGMKSSTFDT